MGKAKTLNNVVINMTLKSTQTRAKLSTSSEDLAVQMGKINKWYDSLVPTGGASGNILEWDSDGVAKWVAPSFLDEKVKSTLLAQSTAEGSYRPTFVTGAGTGGVNIIDSFKVNHTPGTTSDVGNTRLILGNATASGTANNEEGQLKLYSSGTSFHTLKGTTVSSEVIHVLPSTGGTILNHMTTTYTQTSSSSADGVYEIGKIKINGTTTTIYGHDVNTTYTATDGIKIESNVIKHTNSIATAASVFKKISYDAQGHITGTANVTAADLPAHTHEYVPLKTNSGVGIASGNGTYTWCKIATLTVTGAYANGPIAFELSQRQEPVTLLQVSFASANNADPGLSYFVTNYSRRYYIKKTATSTWELYGNYTEAWGSISLHRVTGFRYNNGVSVAINLENIEEPTDMTQASYGGNVSYAATAGKVGSSTIGSSKQPIYLNGGTATPIGYTIETSVPQNALFTDEKVKVTSNATSKGYIIATTQSPDGTAVGAIADTSVYLGTTSGELCAGMVTISNSQWAPLSIKRIGTQSAGIKFINNNGDLGYIAMNSVNGPLMRWKTDSSTSYNILDTSSTSFTQVLSIGTKIGTIKIDGVSTDIFAPADTDINVRQNVSTSTESYPVLLGAYHIADPYTNGFSPTQTTDESYMTEKMWIQPSTAKLTTKGDIVFYSADSNPTPGVYFRRGTWIDSPLDWRIYDKEGKLLFERTIAGSTQSWETKVSFAGDGIYYGSTKVSLDGHMHTVTVNNGSTTLTNYAITFVANPNTTEADAFYKTNDARFQVVNGTASSGGTIGLILGNTKNATTADNKRGLIYLYDSGTYYAQISTNSLTDNRAITLPNDSGTVALTKNIPTIAASSNNGYLSVNSTDILVYSTGLAHTKFNQAAENVTTDAWATVGVDPAGRGYILKSLRYNTNYPVWAYAHCAGIVFGGQDTKGMINMSYSSPAITFAGGNHSDSKTAPVWYMKITGTAGATYNLANFVTTDTKNTAGSTDTSSKIYLIGATTQAANPQTYSDNEVYTTSGVLTTKKVQVGGGNCTMEYNSTTQSLDFVFAS